METLLEPHDIAVDKPNKIAEDSPPMIKSLKIENFRCFQKLALEDLGPVNIIVGQNGSGKTSLI